MRQRWLGPMLVPAMARIAARFGKVPGAVTADRGYGETGVDAGLEAMGVKKVVIPRKGKPGAARREVQGRRGFRKLVKWRTGSEQRISSLKRDHGWRRSLVDGTAEPRRGAWGVLANNATKISALVTSGPAPAPPGRTPAPPGRTPDAPARPGTGPPRRRRAASPAEPALAPSLHPARPRRPATGRTGGQKSKQGARAGAEEASG